MVQNLAQPISPYATGSRYTQRIKKPDLVRSKSGFRIKLTCFNDRVLVPLVIIVVFKFVVVIEIIVVDFIPLVVVDILVGVVIL